MDEARAKWMAAFVAAQKAMPTIAKTRTADAGSYSYKYADLGDLLASALPVLHEQGLALSQPAVSIDGRVGCRTLIYHVDGWVEEFEPFLLAGGSNAQSSGSALTYARRYAAQSALGLSIEEDDDGHAAMRSQSPAFELGKWAASAMAIFKSWDEDRRRKEWIEAIGVLFDGRQPADPSEGAQVIEAVSKIYYAEHDEEAPF